MASFNKFQDFVEQLGKGIHQLHAAGHAIKFYLSNAPPSAADDAIKTDLAEISNGNGYDAPVDIEQDYTESGGTGTMTGVDKVVTATGSVGPFQYVVLYNEDPAAPVDPLICWWDYGSEISLSDGETFTVDFGASVLTLA